MVRSTGESDASRSDRIESVSPVFRASMKMSHGDDPDNAILFDPVDRIGKSRNPAQSNRLNELRNSRQWVFFNSSHRLANGDKERQPQPGTPLVVPDDGGVELGRSRVVKPNRVHEASAAIDRTARQPRPPCAFPRESRRLETASPAPRPRPLRRIGRCRAIR
jgi:hypothetical protein